MPADDPALGRDLDAQKELDLRLLIELATRYGVSLEATLNRVVEVSAHPCAIVFSRSGTVRYVCRHSDFPWVVVGKGHALPRDSLTAKHRGPLRKPTELDAVDIEEWIEKPLEKHGAQLLEQVLPQADGHCVTMLLLDVDSKDDDDE